MVARVGICGPSMWGNMDGPCGGTWMVHVGERGRPCGSVRVARVAIHMDFFMKNLQIFYS